MLFRKTPTDTIEVYTTEFGNYFNSNLVYSDSIETQVYQFLEYMTFSFIAKTSIVVRNIFVSTSLEDFIKFLTQFDFMPNENNTSVEWFYILTAFISFKLSVILTHANHNRLANTTNSLLIPYDTKNKLTSLEFKKIDLKYPFKYSQQIETVSEYLCVDKPHIIVNIERI